MSALSTTTDRETYLRFVVGCDHDRADTLDGLFVMSRQLRDDGQLAPHEDEWLEQLFDWFNQELPCPPFSGESFPADALSWFRPQAARFIHRMWDFAALLREHGRPVRLLTSAEPGRILYQDDYQIVAVPKRYQRRKRARLTPRQC